jgi:hypothetical protein
MAAAKSSTMWASEIDSNTPQCDIVRRQWTMESAETAG